MRILHHFFFFLVYYVVIDVILWSCALDRHLKSYLNIIYIIQVVTKKTPFVSDIIGVSGFGLSNGFSHVILKRNNKTKKNIKNTEKVDFIPRLILASGRDEENAREAVNTVNTHFNLKHHLFYYYKTFSYQFI